MEQIAEFADTAEASHSTDDARSERLWIIAAGVIVAIQLWFGLISTSFWLDETGTWWVVKDGAAEAVRRSLFWSGQSPLFYLIAWFSSRLFGLNEVALRIPSVLAMCGAVYFVYRIAGRLYDRAGAAPAAFVFLCIGSYFAIDARPYALAILCLTVSTWALLRWLDSNRTHSNRTIDAIVYVIASAMVVYAHCVVSVGLGVGVIYAVVTARKQPRRLVWMGLMVAAIALLSLPLLSQLKTFYATRSVHTFTSPPAVDDLLGALIPAGVAGAIVLLTWLLMVFRRETEIAGKCTGLPALLVVAWSLFAPLFLFLLAALTDLRLYVPKYYSSALPGQALLVGGLLSSVQRSAVRKALIVVVAAVSILTYGKLRVTSHGNEDWRTAMEFVGKEAGGAPVLLVSGFVEASGFAALRDPKLREVLFAPELMYGGPADGIRLPNFFNGISNPDMEGIARQLATEPRFFLVTENPDRSYEMWLLGRLGSRCRSQTTGSRFGYLWVVRFACDKY